MTTLEQITIDTPDGAMPAAAAVPADEARGAVVVIQEAFGVTSHIEDIARRLADAGWYSVAPALFHREGAPVLGYDDFDAVMPVMSKLSAEGITTDLEATFDHLGAAGHGVGRTGIVGFCMGGSVSLYAGTLRPLGAAVTYYGGGVTAGRFGLPALVDLAPGLRAPWLGLFGDKDTSIPVADVEALRQAAATAGVPTEVQRYAEAEHGFNCDARPSYNAEAAADAWARTLAWFDHHLSG